MGLDNPLHLVFLLLILLLVFGAKRLPEMGRSLGDGLRGFKETISGAATGSELVSPAANTALPMVAAATDSEPAVPGPTA
jgi:sec-independent protein translocase protein TatA